MLFGSDTAATIAELLGTLHFDELAPLPAVPVTNSRRIGYPVEVTMRRDGSRWAVRSYGTDFELVGGGRRATGGQRWYSIGWGLDRASSVPELLLVQADDISATDMAALVPVLTARTERWTHTLRDAQLRLSAVIPAPEGR
ncbi:hypothetical protein [Actinoplanes sp. N902-109]|uniref:hypothetical protein n=1 Tax=Actinoplanes sp. (strain N902-109) TaxID=649831 RepID=UPI0003294480|nr:hypothetical protein [Actinoplanes sp. N902-109]AGL19159.1 hypothetical protein L083_5649 [Actinoplanes sp. N902-109]